MEAHFIGGVSDMWRELHLGLSDRWREHYGVYNIVGGSFIGEYQFVKRTSFGSVK